MLKQKYASQQTAVASYDYEDIASGTGYVVYYGGHLTDGSTSGSYVLSENVFYSNDITTAFNVTADRDTFIKRFDLDFDVKFNLPRIIKGNMIICIPLGIGRDDATGVTTTSLSGSVYLYDGTTETELGTYHTDTLSGDDDAVGTYVTQVMSCVVDISQQKFKKGDILRLSVECWAKNTAPANKYVGIGHDPKSRDDPGTTDEGKIIYDAVKSAYGETIMEVHVPFKVDL